MLTRLELCQHFLAKGQQKFGKPMTELDAYYAGSEVGLALAFLGMITDQNTLDYIKHNVSALFKFNGKELTYLELLNLLPEKEIKDTNTKSISKVEKKELVKEQTKEQRSQELFCIKERLGERKYFRLLDAFEYLKSEEIEVAINLLKIYQKDHEPKKGYE